MDKKFRKEIPREEDYSPLINELALISTDFAYAFRSHHGYHFWRPLTRNQVISHLALNSASLSLANEGHNLQIVTPQEIRHHAGRAHFSWYPKEKINVLMVWGEKSALHEYRLASEWMETDKEEWWSNYFYEFMRLYDGLNSRLADGTTVPPEDVHNFIVIVLRNSQKITSLSERHELRNMLRLYQSYLHSIGEDISELDINIDTKERTPSNLTA
ncbi:MAG: hypothetical protein G01um101429_256 [Parcubacteria group bacterium Gr01-1014_29]|nr:MAG: hypothetical protein G01um101429_256 [Parcubacteria group bacterium Gr01-1014_29]